MARPTIGAGIPSVPRCLFHPNQPLGSTGFCRSTHGSWNRPSVYQPTQPEWQRSSLTYFSAWLLCSFPGQAGELLPLGLSGILQRHMRTLSCGTSLCISCPPKTQQNTIKAVCCFQKSIVLTRATLEGLSLFLLYSFSCELVMLMSAVSC